MMNMLKWWLGFYWKSMMVDVEKYESFHFFHTFSYDNAPPITSTFQNSSHESFIVINDTNNETFASCTSLVTWDGWNGRRIAVVSLLFWSVKMCKSCSLLFRIPPHDIECLALATNVQPAIGSTPDSLPGWWHRYAPWLQVGLRPSITAGRKVCRKKSQLSGVPPWIPGNVYMVWSWSVERWGLGSFPVERWAHVLWTSLDHVIPEPLQQLLYSLFRYRDGLRCSRGKVSVMNRCPSLDLSGSMTPTRLSSCTSRIPDKFRMVCRMSQWGPLSFPRFQIWLRPPVFSQSSWPDTKVFNSVGFFLVLFQVDSWTSSTSQYFWGVQMNSKLETPKVTYFQFPQFNGQDAYRHSLWVTLHVWSWLIMFGHHFWCSKMFQTWFKHVRNIVLSLWLLIQFMLLRLEFLLRNCCTWLFQCTKPYKTNSGPLSWQFQDVCHSSTMARHLACCPCILQRWHDSACGTLSRSMTITRPSSSSSRISEWFAACHRAPSSFPRFQIWVSLFPGNHLETVWLRPPLFSQQLARHQGFQERWFLTGSLTPEHYRHQLSSTQRKCCPGMELFQVDLFNITVLLGGSDEFETWNAQSHILPVSSVQRTGCIQAQPLGYPSCLIMIDHVWASFLVFKNVPNMIQTCPKHCPFSLIAHPVHVAAPGISFAKLLHMAFSVYKTIQNQFWPPFLTVPRCLSFFDHGKTPCLLPMHSSEMTW